jgi:murein DD-endopeptidase MepM/ murein hydrolase activator NlpD
VNRRLLVALLVGVGLLAMATPGGRANATPPVTSRGAGGAGVLSWPVAGFVLTQGFGCTSLALEPIDTGCAGGHFHSGLDLAAPAGVDVRAAAPGLVVLVQHDELGYGTHVVLDHGGGVTTMYAHLLDASVHTGDLLLEGDRVGLVGSTGNSTGPHLHFEVREQGHPVDPEAHLPAHPSRGGFQ